MVPKLDQREIHLLLAATFGILSYQSPIAKKISYTLGDSSFNLRQQAPVCATRQG